MAQFGHLVAVLSLCLLAVMVNSQENTNPQGQQTCTLYTQSGTLLLDLSKVLQMMQTEFGWAIQTLNPMVIQQWMDDVDDDHDKLLNMAECSKLVQRISDSIRRPNAQP